MFYCRSKCNWIFAGYMWAHVSYLWFVCELCMPGCIRWCRCRVSTPRCRNCRSWGQRGRTPEPCRYTGWPLNCLQLESGTALPPERPSTWSQTCQFSRWRWIHPLDNRALKDTQGVWYTENHEFKSVPSVDTYRWCSWEPVLQDCCQPGWRPSQTSGMCGHMCSCRCSSCWWCCSSPLHRLLSWWRLCSCWRESPCPRSACSFLLSTPQQPETVGDRGLTDRTAGSLVIF